MVVRRLAMVTPLLVGGGRPARESRAGLDSNCSRSRRRSSIALHLASSDSFQMRSAARTDDASNLDPAPRGCIGHGAAPLRSPRELRALGRVPERNADRGAVGAPAGAASAARARSGLIAYRRVGGAVGGTGSQASHQEQHDDDDEDHAHYAAWSVTPAAGMRPGRQYA